MLNFYKNCKKALILGKTTLFFMVLLVNGFAYKIFTPFNWLNGLLTAYFMLKRITVTMQNPSYSINTTFCVGEATEPSEVYL